MKLIHITDLHLRAPGELVAGLDPLRTVTRAIDDINRHHADAGLIVFTGDLSDDGSVASYRALHDALARLVPPWRLLLGNHDDRDAFRTVFTDAADADGFVQSIEDGDAGRLVFLDTLDAGAVDGWLCERRLAWLDQRLAEAGDRPAMVFLHHPPFAIGMPPLDAVGLRAPETLAAVLARHGNVRHLFAGHVHRLCSGVWRGIPFATGRGTNHQSDALFGAATFATSFEAPTYNVVLIDGDDVAVHAHEFSGYVSVISR